MIWNLHRDLLDHTNNNQVLCLHASLFKMADGIGLDCMPTEIVHKIMFSGHLSPQDVFNVALASKTMKEIVLGDEFAVRRAKSSTLSLSRLNYKRDWAAIRTGLMYGTLEPQKTLSKLIRSNEPCSKIPEDVKPWMSAAQKAIALGAKLGDFWATVDAYRYTFPGPIVKHALLMANEDDNTTAQRRFDDVAKRITTTKMSFATWPTYAKMSLDRGLIMSFDSALASVLSDDLELVERHVEVPDVFIPPKADQNRVISLAFKFASVPVIAAILSIPTVCTDSILFEFMDAGRFIIKRLGKEETEQLAEIVLSVADLYQRNMDGDTVFTKLIFLNRTTHQILIGAWQQMQLPVDHDDLFNVIFRISPHDFDRIFQRIKSFDTAGLIDPECIVTQVPGDWGELTFTEALLVSKPFDFFERYVETIDVSLPSSYPTRPSTLSQSQAELYDSNKKAYMNAIKTKWKHRVVDQ